MAGLEVLNRADVAYAPLAQVDRAHLKIALAGLVGTGVVSNPAIPFGCAATANGVNRDIAITAGVCIHDSNIVEVAAGTVTPAVGHATYGRFDLIVADEAGVLSIVAGTAAPTPTYADPPTDKVALWGVYVEAGDTLLVQAKLQDLRVKVPGSPIYDGDQIQRASLGEMGIYGHSYAEGIGASDGLAALMGTAGAERGVAARLCAMFGMRARSLAKGGAVLARNNQLSTGDGGYQTVFQYEQRTVRAGTTLNGGVSAGATTIVVTSATGFQVGQAIHIGTGALGANGGEVRYIAFTAGTTFTLDKALDRAHLTTEPVYEVAPAFLAWRSIDILWWGLHDLAYSPISSTVAKYRARYDDALEMVIARCLAAEFYENEHPSQVYTGTWGTDTTAGVYSGVNGYTFNAVNAKATIHVMDNYNGEAITLYFVATHQVPATAEPVLTFRVDGNSIGTKTVYQNYTGWRRGFCKRITGLTPGRHVIEAELTTYDASLLVAYDGWTIEATVPSLVLVPGFTRMLDDYNYYNTLNGGAGTDNQPRTTTLTGTHGVGTTTWTVGSTTDWQVGTTVTLEPGDANKESLEVLTVGAGTFTTAASTLSHAGGVTVRSGIQDADIATMNVRQQAIVNTFGESVVWIDADAALNRNASYFGFDHDHPNDLGHQVLAAEFYNSAMAAPTVKPTLALTTTVPATPNEIAYMIIGPTTWTNMATAEQEIQNVQARRLKRTLRRFHQMKFEIGVLVVGAAAAICYPKYSLDGGTTWKKFDRTATGAQGTGHHLSLAALGSLESSWLALPEEVRTTNVMFTLWGSGGDGALDPAIAYATCVFR